MEADFLKTLPCVGSFESPGTRACESTAGPSFRSSRSRASGTVPAGLACLFDRFFLFFFDAISSLGLSFEMISSPKQRMRVRIVSHGALLPRRATAQMGMLHGTCERGSAVRSNV